MGIVLWVFCSPRAIPEVTAVLVQPGEACPKNYLCLDNKRCSPQGELQNPRTFRPAYSTKSLGLTGRRSAPAVVGFVRPMLVITGEAAFRRCGYCCRCQSLRALLRSGHCSGLRRCGSSRVFTWCFNLSPPPYAAGSCRERGDIRDLVALGLNPSRAASIRPS